MSWLIGTRAEIADQLLAFEKRHAVPFDPEHRGRLCPPAPFGRVLRYADIVEAVDGRAAICIDDRDLTADGVDQPVNGRSVTISTKEAVEELPADFVVRESRPADEPVEPAPGGPRNGRGV